MNFTRILGQNDKIYKKFGDYCFSEADNECFVVCSCCQEEHQSEDSFWQHIRDVHNYVLPQPMQLMQSPLISQPLEQQQLPEQQQMDAPTNNKRIKFETSPDSPIYADAEYLEQLGDINDSDIMEDLSPFLLNEEESQKDSDTRTKGEKPQHPENIYRMSTFKSIDIERIPSKSLLNGKVLRRLFLQMKRTHIEFKYKLNRLTQEVKVLEREMRDENIAHRKKYMKIIPDSPMTTRDEVLMLDSELHRSKEMRNNLHEEALMVITESPDVYCRVLWRFIMTDEVSNQFCWRGVIDGDKVIKYPIKDMTLLDIFQAAFREKFPSQPLNTFKEKTITYFNKANERIKRSKMERTKMVKHDYASDDTCEDVYC